MPNWQRAASRSLQEADRVLASRSRGRSATLLGFRFQAYILSSRSQLGLHGAKVMVFGRRENFLREAVDVLTRAGCEAGIRRANMRLSSASY